MRAVLALVVLIAVPSALQAAESHRLAFSEKLGVEVHARADASGQWCKAKLQLSFSLKKTSPLLNDGGWQLMPKLAPVLAQECPVAEAAEIVALSVETGATVAPPFTASRGDGWQAHAVADASPSGQAKAESVDAFIAALQKQPNMAGLIDVWNDRDQNGNEAFQSKQDARKAFFAKYYDLSEPYYNQLLSILNSNNEIISVCSDLEKVSVALDDVKNKVGQMPPAPNVQIAKARNIVEPANTMPERIKLLQSNIAAATKIVDHCAANKPPASMGTKEGLIAGVKAQTTVDDLVTVLSGARDRYPRLLLFDEVKSAITEKACELREPYFRKYMEIIDAHKVELNTYLDTKPYQSILAGNESSIAKIFSADPVKKSYGAAQKALERIDRDLKQLPDDPGRRLKAVDASFNYIDIWVNVSEKYVLLRKDKKASQDLLESARARFAADTIIEKAKSGPSMFGDKLVGLWGSAAGNGKRTAHGGYIALFPNGTAHLIADGLEQRGNGNGISGEVEVGAWNRLGDDILVIGSDKIPFLDDSKTRVFHTVDSKDRASYDIVSNVLSSLGVKISTGRGVLLEAKIVEISKDHMQLQFINTGVFAGQGSLILRRVE